MHNGEYYANVVKKCFPFMHASLLQLGIWSQDALKQLWRLAYPDRVLPGLKSELWKDMGWQGPDPSTDFRFA